MTRHPATEGNELEPSRVDAKDDVTVPDGEGGRVSLSNVSGGVSEEEARKQAIKYAVAL